MATARPCVSIYKAENPDEKTGTVPMPHVLGCGLRPDLVRYVHMNMSKNTRQAHGVKAKAGYGYAAESWGTGRAVARIPRVPGGGTHAAGQGAFGNMCRGGGMFAPLRVWRRWHRHVNLKEKRHAVVTCLSASSLPPLVMARGHRIEEVAELPLVVSDGAEKIRKTKAAVELLKKLGCDGEIRRLMESRKVRSGHAKLRIGRYRVSRGPLLVYGKDKGIVRACRNIPGVETASVTRLNLLTLAPGGQFGRFIIWTESAFRMLKKMYGTHRSGAPMKKNYTLPRNVMDNADIARIINSDEVQSVVRPKLERPRKHDIKRNPLKNKRAMAKLNPAFTDWLETRKRKLTKGTKENDEERAAKKKRDADKRAHNKKYKKGPDTFYKKIMKAFDTKAEATPGDEEE